MKYYTNDIYENLGLSADSQDKMVDNMANVIESSERSGTNDIRRMKSMRRNVRSEILKKVAVASVSVGLSTALIAGIVSYNKNMSGEKTDVAKEVVKTTEKNTEAVTDKEKNYEENTDNVDEIAEYAITKTFKKIDFTYRTSITSRAKIGNCIVELFNNSENKKGTYEINVKTGKNKFEKVDTFAAKVLYDTLGFYTYGTDLYYFTYDGLKKLDLDSLKAEYVMEFKNVNLATPYQTIFNIDDKYIYMSCETGNPGDPKDDTEWTGQINYMYSYNIKTKKLNLLKNRIFHAMINEKYIVTSDATEYKTEQGLEKIYLPLYVEKIEDGKVETVTKLGENAKANYAPLSDFEYSSMHVMKSGEVLLEYNGIPYCDETLRGIQLSSANEDKFYYEDFESVDKNNAIDYSKVTIKSYDLKTDKIEKVSTISLKDCNIPEEDGSFVAVLSITDDYCLIDTLVDDKTTGETKKVKYYFKEKKIEKVEY